MERLVYILVDGENIDRTLGQILGAKPEPKERPRWDRIRTFGEEWAKKKSKSLFFLNARNGLPGAFIQALRLAGFVPVPVKGERKPVDLAIQKTLRALSGEDVLLVSHDQDFCQDLQDLVEDGGRLGVLGFQEFVGGEFFSVPEIEIFDLEEDANAFDVELKRIRITEARDFNPMDIIG